MTGTGTKDDPYIVDNWEEYSSIGHEQVTYAEFAPNAENKVIDFNEICPEGFSNPVKFTRYTNFNGWTLKNLHSTAQHAITVGSAGKFSNLTLENFYFCPQSTIGKLIDCNNSGGTFTNCIISGQIQTPNQINYVIYGSLYESSLNIIANADDTFKVATNFVNSDIVLDISSKSVSLCLGKIINSRISGRIQSDETVSAGNEESAYNVFNIQSNQPLDYQGKGISVYNSDISSSVASESFKGCTAEQLRDAQYLYDLRFPIGVD
ncbi:MAG: hypothetical protein K2I80_07505 [Ruminococcus sp.]|nr:hypothetical protein [Ruminococcus sp.]